MTPANLRGILHRGVGASSTTCAEDADPLHPSGWSTTWTRRILRAEAERCLQLIITRLVENYEHYATTTDDDAVGLRREPAPALRLPAPQGELRAGRLAVPAAGHGPRGAGPAAAAGGGAVAEHGQQITRPVADKL